MMNPGTWNNDPSGVLNEMVDEQMRRDYLEYRNTGYDPGRDPGTGDFRLFGFGMMAGGILTPMGPAAPRLRGTFRLIDKGGGGAFPFCVHKLPCLC